MNAADRIREANSIEDKRALRLLTVEAVAVELVGKHGDCAPEDGDEHAAALWHWVAAECRAAREALGQLAALVRAEGGGDDATS